MTIKELYEWAVKNDIEEYEIQIQYRDSGGYYSGTDDLNEYDIEINKNSCVVVL